jgi:hypothetical protein
MFHHFPLKKSFDSQISPGKSEILLEKPTFSAGKSTPAEVAPHPQLLAP